NRWRETTGREINENTEDDDADQAHDVEPRLRVVEVVALVVLLLVLQSVRSVSSRHHREAGDRLVLRCDDIEQRRQLRDDKEVVNAPRELHQFDLTTSLLNGEPDRDHRREARCIHERDLSEIEHELSAALLQQAVHSDFDNVFFPEHEPALEIEERGWSHTALANLHKSSKMESCYEDQPARFVSQRAKWGTSAAPHFASDPRPHKTRPTSGPRNS